MKKIVLSIIVALIAITANAQVYVGGTFGVGCKIAAVYQPV